MAAEQRLRLQHAALLSEKKWQQLDTEKNNKKKEREEEDSPAVCKVVIERSTNYKTELYNNANTRIKLWYNFTNTDTPQKTICLQQQNTPYRLNVKATYEHTWNCGGRNKSFKNN